MAQLNQMVAIEKGVRTKAERELTDLHRKSQKVELLTGISRTYQPRDEDGEQLPPEGTLVQVDAEDVLKSVSKSMTRMFNVILTKDRGNTEAGADIVVDGRTISTNVPVPYLLWMEKELDNIKTFIAKIPTLDPAVKWERDANTGTYRSEDIMTTRGKKVPRILEKSPATEKHQAQVDVWYEDIVVGDWTTVKYSGALPAERRTELLERVDQLMVAVKFAREEANQHEVTDQEIGRELFDFILTG